MSIFVIGDLHLSFNNPKPMDIFGEHWAGHEEKVKANWIENVSENDLVILPGDFSWSMKLNDTVEDFKFLNELPGKKILLKGNHDYWWTTVTNMKKFLKDNNLEKIDFLYNNSYCIENKIIVGTRGWNILDNENDNKMVKRESVRLELSIQNAIKEYGENKEIIAFMHYPPITLNSMYKKEDTEFIKILKKYKIKKCYYAHLHGNSHKDAVIGEVDEIDYKLISADYLDFDLVEI